MAKKTTKKKPSRKLPKDKYDSKEWDWPQDCSKGGKTWDKNIRILYIKNLFARGIMDPNRQELAALMGVSRRTIFTDFQDIYKAGFSLEEAKIAENLLGNSLKNAIIEVSDQIVTGGKKDKLAAIKVLGDIGEKYTNFLEKFDIKKLGEIDQSDNELVIKWLPMEEQKKTGGK